MTKKKKKNLRREINKRRCPRAEWYADANCRIIEQCLLTDISLNIPCRQSHFSVADLHQWGWSLELLAMWWNKNKHGGAWNREVKKDGTVLRSLECGSGITNQTLTRKRSFARYAGMQPRFCIISKYEISHIVIRFDPYSYKLFYVSLTIKTNKQNMRGF